MSDQDRIFNIANSHAELIAEQIATVTDRPMTVLVQVFHRGETMAEGFSTTDDYGRAMAEETA